MQKVNFNIHPAIEICVDNAQSACAAEAGGAKRIELCNSLTEGGTTPSAGLIEVVRNSIDIDIHVLIRPRRGDFLYSDMEFEIMKKDIAMAKQLGANGVVLGILKKDGNVDTGRMQALIEHAMPMSVTFHRAFDLTPDPLKALDDLLHLKIDRLLTSGQEKTALLGANLIRELILRADGKLIIMPGGGINPRNIRDIAKITGAKEFHSSALIKMESHMTFRKKDIPMAKKQALSEFEIRIADENRIKSMLEAVESYVELNQELNKISEVKN